MKLHTKLKDTFNFKEDNTEILSFVNKQMINEKRNDFFLNLIKSFDSRVLKDENFDLLNQDNIENILDKLGFEDLLEFELFFIGYRGFKDFYIFVAQENIDVKEA